MKAARSRWACLGCGCSRTVLARSHIPLRVMWRIRLTAYWCLARAEVEAKLRKAAIKTLRSAELKKQFGGAGMRSTTQGEDDMRAAVLTEVNKPLQILDLEQEPPKANEVRVQVKAAGVCMSDWHIMNGAWPMPLPMVLGHEAAGVVVENGPGVTAVKPGDHVIFSFRPHCGHCRYCAKGRTVLCSGHNDTPRWRMHDGTARLKLNGEPVNQMARIGTFSDYVVCPAEQVVKVREDLPWTHAAIIGCSVATGVGAVIRHANVEAGSSVLVVGCGGVGLNVVQGAKLAGAKTIIAADLLDNKLGYAREFGATHTINARTEDVVKRVQELTLGLGCDYAFDAIGGDKTAVTILDAID